MAQGKHLHIGISLAVLVSILAFAFRHFSTPDIVEPYIFGRNNTVLFLTNQEYGLCNVHVATAAQLAQSHGQQLDLHYASFEPMKKKLDHATAHIESLSSGADLIKWHEITGISGGEALARALGDGADVPNAMSHGTGLDSLNMTKRTQSLGPSPWVAEEAWDIYQQVVRIIEDVDPAVIVLDMLFGPGWDVTRSMNRAHVILSPNDLITMFSDWQPRGAMFWKYPSWGSGLPFPLPWTQIPLNTWLRVRTIVAFITNSEVWQKRSYLLEKGVKSPLSFLRMHQVNVPWIAMSMTEANIPLIRKPPNVTECGPIVMSMGDAKDQDSELANWLKRRPTVLIHFGTLFMQQPPDLLAMIEALDVVLTKTEVQVVWKVGKLGINFQHERWTQILGRWAQADRLRIVDWFKAEPASLLMTGDIILSVHHGGASSYYDAVQAGVPHLILPQWSDHYNFATTAEYLGIGIWGSKETAPSWDAQALERNFMLALEGERSKSMKTKAKELGEVSRTYGGSKCAAGIIADMAAKGY